MDPWWMTRRFRSRWCVASLDLISRASSFTVWSFWAWKFSIAVSPDCSLSASSNASSLPSLYMQKHGWKFNHLPALLTLYRLLLNMYKSEESASTHLNSWGDERFEMEHNFLEVKKSSITKRRIFGERYVGSKYDTIKVWHVTMECGQHHKLWRVNVEDYALFLPKFDFIAFQKKILEMVDRDRAVTNWCFQYMGLCKVVRRLENWKLFCPFLGLLFCNGKYDMRCWMDGYN